MGVAEGVEMEAATTVDGTEDVSEETEEVHQMIFCLLYRMCLLL